MNSCGPKLTRFERAEYPCQTFATPTEVDINQRSARRPTLQEPDLSDTKQIFSPAQRSLLADVLNRIIPPNNKLPGAGNLGVTDFVEAAAAASPSLTR